MCQLNINRELKEAMPSVATEQQKMYQHQPNQCLIRPLFHSSEKAGLKPLHGLNEINGLHWVKICLNDLDGLHGFKWINELSGLNV